MDSDHHSDSESGFGVLTGDRTPSPPRAMITPKDGNCDRHTLHLDRDCQPEGPGSESQFMLCADAASSSAWFTVLVGRAPAIVHFWTKS